MPYPRSFQVIWSPGHYYHLYNRGAHRESLFREPANYQFVIQKALHYCARFELGLVTYCLMPNHYHFLVYQRGHAPAGFLPQRVFNSYTKAYNKKYDHSGTLFQGRYQAKLIDNDGHLLHLCRYIHGNPVKSGLVDGPEEWPYSNYEDWHGLSTYDFIADQFDNQRDYAEFVREYLEEPA